MKLPYFISLCIAFILVDLQAQSNLWGTSSCYNDGVIFRTNGSGDHYEEVFQFNEYPGANPGATRLLEASNGLFYAMTDSGGCGDAGVIFSYNTATNQYQVVHEFQAFNGPQHPYGSLIQARDGYLYGMTAIDANSGFGLGTLFRFDIGTNSLTQLVQFTGTGGNGSGPFGDLLQASDDKLYGMTAGSAAHGGNIFSYDITNDTLIVLHTFGTVNTDGKYPFGSLIQAANGRLYGMTADGGTSNLGTIFEYDLSTGYNKLFDFTGTTGAVRGSYPYGDLIEDSNNMLYGMTYSGSMGPNDAGVLFKLDVSMPNSPVYTHLQDFNGTISAGSVGGYPNASLVKANNGKLYGLAQWGGSNGLGTLFEYHIDTNTLAKRVDFDGMSKGVGPVGSLMQGSNGTLYGMARHGGASLQLYSPGYGTLFEFNPSNNSFFKAARFLSNNRRHFSSW
jgi:uncharacterized repeat protein (TIGR03803 family)